MILGLYRFLATVGAPAISHYLSKRLMNGREDPLRFTERRGEASVERPPGKLLWMHGASVGEALSMLPVIDWLREHRAGINILVTTGTVTSAALLAERLPAGVVHQYVPVDCPIWVRRFLKHWRPDRAFWFESELWPNLLTESRRQGVPMTLVNGRMSPRSYRHWRLLPGVSRELLGCFDACLGQTETDAQRFRDLGAERVSAPGNLKVAADPLPTNEEALKHVKNAIGSRPTWLASSTHVGEEVMAGRLHRALSAAHPDLLTIIVPRHPERGSKIAYDIRKQGLRVVRLTDGGGTLPGPDHDVYVADTVGDLGLFYRVADVVFMGKSLLAQGGQNPIEPGHFAKPVLFGPHMQNFADMTAKMLEASAARQIANEEELKSALAELLSDEAARHALGEAARTFAVGQRAVLDKVMAELADRLPEDDKRDMAK